MTKRNFTTEEKQVVERLIPYAKRKSFVAELLVSGYNSQIATTDVGTLMRYNQGEPAGSTYIEDIFTYLRVISRGIETHEIIGQTAMDELLQIVPRYKCPHCLSKLSDDDLNEDDTGNFRCLCMEKLGLAQVLDYIHDNCPDRTVAGKFVYGDHIKETQLDLFSQAI